MHPHSPKPHHGAGIPIINTDFSKWTKELNPIAFIQEKFAELNTITYKNYFQIFVNGSKMNKKVASAAFIPTDTTAFGKRLHDNVSVMSAELNAIIMALKFLMVNEFMIDNLKNIIIYSGSLSSLELLPSASQYKTDTDIFHCLRIIFNLTSSSIICSGSNGLNFQAFSYQFLNSSGEVPSSPFSDLVILKMKQLTIVYLNVIY